MHLQSSCFSHKTDCFLTLLLSSSSSLLKVTNVKSTDSVNIFNIRSDFVKLLLSNQDPDL